MKKIMRILAVTVVFSISLTFEAAALETDYVLSGDGRQEIPIPVTYRVSGVIDNLGAAGNFFKAEDIFIDARDRIYVADTGNNRVIRLTGNGDVEGIYQGPEEKPMSNPRGIFADDDGDMYVADTDNNRIVHLSATGVFIEEFVSPESEVLGKGFTLQPSKVFVSDAGYIYVIKNHTFLSMDAGNMFRGYVGAPPVGFSFTRMLIRLFASQEQKDKLARVNPSSYTNFVIAGDGMIYATSGSKSGQIKKINAIGRNIYKDEFFGEMEINESTGQVAYPYFIDLAVDRNGIISALEKNTGRIYQYDQEGSLLTVFGGIAPYKGYFETPASIACDSQGRIYVLDSSRNNIQVFEPTGFIKLVHGAVRLYTDGKYDEAKGVWLRVLDLSETYFLAHAGLGKVLFKEGRWKEAMEEYRLAENQWEYSRAFTEYRGELFRDYFGWVVLAFILCLLFVLRALYLLKDLAATILGRHSRWL